MHRNVVVRFHSFLPFLNNFGNKMSQTIKVSFNPVVKTYTLIDIAVKLMHGTVTIPLALLWMLGIGQWYSRINYEKMFCELDERYIKFSSGAFFREIITMPLDKIQDVVLVEGPLLKYFGINIIKIMAAGSSSNISLVGVEGAEQFKQEILNRQLELRRQEEMVSNQQIILLEKILKQLEKNNVEHN